MKIEKYSVDAMSQALTDEIKKDLEREYHSLSVLKIFSGSMQRL